MKKTGMAVAAVLLSVVAAQAQNGPGAHFVENWDLDGDGRVTLEELREKRGNIVLSFDANEDGALDGQEYQLFDEARENDAQAHEGQARAQMRKLADRMSLAANDADGDGRVTQAEFLAGADDWFARLDRNGDGGITTADFGQ